MIEAILSIFNWLVQGIKDILTIITSIPTYIAKVTTMIQYIPPQIRVACSLILAAVVLIKIKRLVLG